jgi:hypothetical protein
MRRTDKNPWMVVALIVLGGLILAACGFSMWATSQPGPWG